MALILKTWSDGPCEHIWRWPADNADLPPLARYKTCLKCGIWRQP